MRARDVEAHGLSVAVMDGTAARSAKVPPTPADACCPGRTRNASPKSAGSSHPRARRSSRSSPGCARSGGGGVSWDGVPRLIVAALCAGAIAQWVRPLPGATLDTPAVHLPGAPPSFAWPSTGAAAASVVGVGARGPGARDPGRPGRWSRRVAGGVRRPLGPPPGTGRRRSAHSRHRRRTHRVSGRAGDRRSPKSPSRPESRSQSSMPSKAFWSTREPTWRRCSPTGTREASALSCRR